MLKLLAATALVSTPALAQATTITVENRSFRPVTMNARQAPPGYEALHATIAPGAMSDAWKEGGKVLMPHDQAASATVRLDYVDANGAGCRFSVAPVRHSAAWAKVRPVAEPIGGGACEARTGSTIGDFVFIVR